MKRNTLTKRRLLIYIYSMGSGGAERVTANLANYWAAKEWDITIVTLLSQNQDFYELHPRVKRLVLGLSGDSSNALVGLWQNARRIFALRKLLREVRPEIALGMMTSANIVTALAAWGLPSVKAIGAEHNHPPQQPMSYLWRTLRKKTYGLLDAVTALASEGASWMRNNTNAKTIAVIPNAVTWPLPEQEPKISPNNFHQPNRKLLLAVGRLHPQKGFDWLIDIFAGLVNKYPSWDLVILGEGALRTELEGQVTGLGLEKRVFLPGRVGNLNEWYESADIYVLSSRYEGFGNTLAEAMAYGTPVISFDCDTGPRDIIRDKVDGLLVPPGDIPALTAALDNMMGDNVFRSELAEHGIEVRKRFSMVKIAQLWEQLFDRVLNDASNAE